MKKLLLVMLLLMSLSMYSIVLADETSELTDEVNNEISEEEEVDDEVKAVEAVRVPILMYHHISDNVENSGIVSPLKFREDMITLKEAGYNTIFLNDLTEYLRGYIELPENPIIITFDDGYQSNFDYAYPVAKELDMKITISPIGWSAGRKTFIESDKKIIPHFTWQEAKKMSASGLVDFQNHTFDLHSPLGESYGYKKNVNQGVLPLDGESFMDYKVRLQSDLLKLNYQIYDQIETLPTFLVYPYGAYNEETVRVLKSIGFAGSATTEHGIRTYETVEDLGNMPRVNVDEYLRQEALLNALAPIVEESLEEEVITEDDAVSQEDTDTNNEND